MGDERHNHGLLIPYRETYVGIAIQNQVFHWAATGPGMRSKADRPLQRQLEVHPRPGDALPRQRRASFRPLAVRSSLGHTST